MDEFMTEIDHPLAFVRVCLAPVDLFRNVGEIGLYRHVVFPGPKMAVEENFPGIGLAENDAVRA